MEHATFNELCDIQIPVGISGTQGVAFKQSY